VLLLDEPLGALDAKLRKSLQVELKALQEEIGITFIYVTHDQEEALTMSDRLAVMNRGSVEQVGTPNQVYEEPSTSYIADFLGLSNLIDDEASGPDGFGACRVEIGGRSLVAGSGRTDATGPVNVCIRPERVVLGGVGNDLDGIVDRVVYMGSMLQVLVDIDGVGELQVVVPNQGNGFAHDRGQPITLGLPPAALRILA
jgi:spermidine/putrescine transport system ATP-binding protein